jgi:hypothetical protein
MKPRKNLDVRAWIVGHGLTYKEVAKEIPISNAGFSGMLQMELTQGMKDEIMQAAKRALLKKEKEVVFTNEEGVFEDRQEALLPD